MGGIEYWELSVRLTIRVAAYPKTTIMVLVESRKWADIIVSLMKTL